MHRSGSVDDFGLCSSANTIWFDPVLKGRARTLAASARDSAAHLKISIWHDRSTSRSAIIPNLMERWPPSMSNCESNSHFGGRQQLCRANPWMPDPDSDRKSAKKKWFTVALIATVRAWVNYVDYQLVPSKKLLNRCIACSGKDLYAMYLLVTDSWVFVLQVHPRKKLGDEKIRHPREEIKCRRDLQSFFCL